MRFKITLVVFGLLSSASLIYISSERNRYNVVSYDEILTIRKQLSTLSPQEKRALAVFFDQGILYDQYPYTLIGYKPMSITTILVEDTEDLLEFCHSAFKSPRHQMLRQGYLVWDKYQSLFLGKNNILVSYSYLGQGRKEVALISSQLCKDTIKNSLNDFHEVLKKPYTGEEVFWILSHPDHNDFYSIIDHTRLVGILLGFGRNNAYLYERYRGGRSRSVTTYLRAEDYPLEMFSTEWPWPGIKLSPNFACDVTLEETQELKKHYKKASKIVYWTYFLRNNLEVTLALLKKN